MTDRDAQGVGWRPLDTPRLVGATRGERSEVSAPPQAPLDKLSERPGAGGTGFVAEFILNIAEGLLRELKGGFLRETIGGRTG